MAKKTFKDNPALQFISTAGNAYADNTHDTDNTVDMHKAHNKHTCTADKQERKTKRLNLLMQPSTLTDLNKIAHMKRTSVNDLINSILKEYVETESAAVGRYDEIFANTDK